jgi:hypothetical protein
MFELLKAAPRMPPLQCTSPAYFEFVAAARSGALGFTARPSLSARDLLIALDRPTFLNRNEECNDHTENE